MLQLLGIEESHEFKKKILYKSAITDQMAFFQLGSQ